MKFASNVNVTILILMKTVKFICSGKNACIASVDTYRDRKGQTGKKRDRQGQTVTDRDRKEQAGAERVPLCP